MHRKKSSGLGYLEKSKSGEIGLCIHIGVITVGLPQYDRPGFSRTGHKHTIMLNIFGKLRLSWKKFYSHKVKLNPKRVHVRTADRARSQFVPLIFAPSDNFKESDPGFHQP